VTRELLWGLPAVSEEVRAWRVRARAIPDVSLRTDALDSIARKRPHADGAALFWILPRRRDPTLLRLLVAYQTIWDYLDNVSERGAHLGERNGRLLHSALVQALDPQVQICDHYRHHLCSDDDGYLQVLIEACREACLELPSYERVRAPVLAEAARCAIQSLNHDPDPASRDMALRAWATAELCRMEASEAGLAGVEAEGGMVEAGLAESEGEAGLAKPEAWPAESFCWFELTAAASASLVPHALLALAAEPTCGHDQIAAAHAAYLPWASLATAMLDSYADRLDDAAAGEHSYIAHYRDEEEAVRRVSEIVDRAARAVGDLSGGHRHAIVVACVVAMYLSKDGARVPAARAATRRLTRSGGSLARLLVPVLRAWRIAYGQRAA
jgi:tetraprenyl-beta-curcumene synthase